MKKRTIFIAGIMAAAMMLFAMTGCAGGSKSADKIVMTYVTAPLNVPSIIEKEQGKYEKAFGEMGLGFEYSELTSGADQTAALASGDIQILNAVSTSSVLLAAANDSDIVILSMYSRAPEAFAIYSNDENIDSPEKLSRLTIAGPKGSNLHELLVSYLSTAGMTIDDVDYVEMDIPSAVAALESGSVNAALISGPAAYNCEKSGKHKITDGEGLIAASICTAVSREFAENNPEIIDVFLGVQNETADDIDNDVEKAVKITSKALDMDENAVRDMLEDYDFSTEISNEDIKQMQDTEQFLYDNNMIEKHVDVNKLIYKTETK